MPATLVASVTLPVGRKPTIAAPSFQMLECGEGGDSLSTSAKYETENDCAEMAEMAHHVGCLVGANLLR